MKLKVKILRLMAGGLYPFCTKIADKLGINIDDRITINKDGKKIISVIDIATGFIKNEIAVSSEIIKTLKLKEHETVDIALAPHPESTELIYKN